MENIERAFARMGARAKLVDDARVTLDVKSDRAGEYFEIRLAPGTELVPLEVKAADGICFCLRATAKRRPGSCAGTTSAPGS